MKKIGVLALQGAVREHIHRLEELGCETVLVTRLEHLAGLDGLILPGGESTTMRKLLDRYDLLEPIRKLALGGLPVFGTCAGLILLAKEVMGYDAHLALMNIVVARNSYGRQADSFESTLDIPAIGEAIPAIFIRAPHIVSVGEGVTVLAEHEGKIVLAREGNLLGCSFHPELTLDLRILKYFVTSIV
ncbi:MAG: pyridoxal 5'-phosphate synthase glutaminase subunit PdxT [Lysinibacillus sp.]